MPNAGMVFGTRRVVSLSNQIDLSKNLPIHLKKILLRLQNILLLFTPPNVQVKDVRVPENLQRAMAAEAEAAREARAKVATFIT